ncbi:MAG: beta-lactamase family protein [Coriobacteriales bacterium]|jgi:CubicO group peptidase (beta-lactamase class C family)|nr:beta-lactamase family protein [Coriobacteriales bacterium]
MRKVDFEGIVTQARSAFCAPSVVAAVSWGGETWYSAIGRRALPGAAVDEDTIYPIASVSKAFIASCIILLADEGLLELDTPVKRYLPQLELFTPELTEQLTVRDMLSHRSGLPRHDATLLTREDATLEETVASLRWLEPCWDLRERFFYQNHMFALASLLVERVSGKPWANVVRERLFAPLGMTRSYTAWREYERYDNNYAQPLATLGRVSLPVRPMSSDSTACAGSLSMSVRDLLRWGQANLALYTDDGPHLIPRSVLEAHRPQTPIRAGEMMSYETPFVDEEFYGFGWFVESYRGVPLIHHGGTTAGFKSIVGFLPEHGCALAVLTNQNASQVPLFVLRMLADAVLGAEPYDWQSFYARVDAERGAKTQREYRAAFALRRQPLPPACAGVYAHPAYGKLRIMNDLGGPRVRNGQRSHRLRPGTRTPWVLDTGIMRMAVPCAFEYEADGGEGGAGGVFEGEATPRAICAWLEPELATPIRFERLRG